MRVCSKDVQGLERRQGEFECERLVVRAVGLEAWCGEKGLEKQTTSLDALSVVMAVPDESDESIDSLRGSCLRVDLAGLGGESATRDVASRRRK